MERESLPSERSSALRPVSLLVAFFLMFGLHAQGDEAMRKRAAEHFQARRYVEAAPLYAQLLSLEPKDHDLNFRYGTCALHNGEDKERVINHLRYALQGPDPSPLAWHFIGKAYHLSYRFKDATAAYERYRGLADRRTLSEFPVNALEIQARNGRKLLNDLKDITVLGKVEVGAPDFFRFYDLADIGGKIVTLPDELRTPLDKRSGERFLVYLPDKGGPIYFSSYGKDGVGGRDIYRTELVSGKFTAPQRVAGHINTAYDEDFPVMAPDGKSFYFSSKGHNSMGGYDVFRCSYDPVSGVFGPPENMDFAVNTPDDDVLYIVDAAGKQACFASGRDSKHGMLHVYRVGTEQLPVRITVLSGTFHNELDAADRAATFNVVDVVTQEEVCAATSAADGAYVLTLPRSGRFRLVVRTKVGGEHRAEFEVPRNDAPVAYAQSASLVDRAGVKLLIDTRTGTPLDVDLAELAMEEIRRRARLDVTGERTLPAAPPPVGQGIAGIMREAGFAEGVTVEHFQEQAQAKNAALKQEALTKSKLEAELTALAVQASAKADQVATEAERTLLAALSEEDPERQRLLMEAAARERHAARTELTRAMAAQEAGQGVRKEAEELERRAGEQERRLEELGAAIRKEDPAAASEALRAVKSAQESPSGADRDRRLREELQLAERTAAGRLETAREARKELAALKDRNARMARELEGMKGIKRAELERNVVAGTEQAKAMEAEVERAFAKASAAEQEARVMRGRALLVDHMGKNLPPEERNVPLTERSGVALRVAEVKERLERMVIEQRHVDAVGGSIADMDRALMQAFREGGGGEAIVATSPLPSPIAQPTAEQTGATVPASPVVADQRATPPAVPPVAGAAGATTTEVGEDQAFLRSNEVAELEQMRAVVSDPAERVLLDARIKALRSDTVRDPSAFVSELEAVLDALPPADHRMARVFVPAMRDSTLAAAVYADHASHAQRIKTGSVPAGAKPEDLEGLALMLVDSIDAEMARQMLRLRLRPTEAEAIAPRIIRLAELRSAQMRHVAEVAREGSELPASEPTIVRSAELQPAAEALPAGHTTARTFVPVFFNVQGIDQREVLLERLQEQEEVLRKLEQVDAADPKNKKSGKQRADVEERISTIERQLDALTVEAHERMFRTLGDSIDQLRATYVGRVDERSPAYATAAAADQQVELLRTEAEALRARLSAPLLTDRPGRDSVAAAETKALLAMRKAVDAHQRVLEQGSSEGLVPQALGEEVQPVATEAKEPEPSVSIVVEPTAVEPVGDLLPTAPHAAMQQDTLVAHQPEASTGTGGGEERSAIAVGTEPVGAPSIPQLHLPMDVIALHAPDPVQEADEQTRAMRTEVDGYAAMASKAHTDMAQARKRDRPALERLALRYESLVEELELRIHEMERVAAACGPLPEMRSDAAAKSRRRAEYHYLTPDEHHLVESDVRAAGFFDLMVLAIEREALALRSTSQADSASAVGDSALAEMLVQRAEWATRQAVHDRAAADRILLTMPPDAARTLRAQERNARQAFVQRSGPAGGQLVNVPTTPMRNGPAVTAPVVERVSASTTRSEADRAEGLAPRIIGLHVAPERERRTVRIPVDAPMPEGLVYKVQVGAFRRPLDQHVFADMDPVIGESTSTGLVRYMAGAFDTRTAATEALAKVRGRGYGDAFVVAYLNGRRVALVDAERAATAVRSEGTTAGPSLAHTPTTVVTTGTSLPVAAGTPSAGSAEAVLATFVPAVDAAAYYDAVPGAAPAVQVEVVAGLFWTVQVGVYSRPVPVTRLQGVAALNSERLVDGKVRYTTGRFPSLQEARAHREDVVAAGVSDAFMTAYFNGRRISLAEAAALLERYGPDVVAPGAR